MGELFVGIFIYCEWGSGPADTVEVWCEVESEGEAFMVDYGKRWSGCRQVQVKIRSNFGDGGVDAG